MGCIRQVAPGVLLLADSSVGWLLERLQVSDRLSTWSTLAGEGTSMTPFPFKVLSCSSIRISCSTCALSTPVTLACSNEHSRFCGALCYANNTVHVSPLNVY